MSIGKATATLVVLILSIYVSSGGELVILHGGSQKIFAMAYEGKAVAPRKGEIEEGERERGKQFSNRRAEIDVQTPSPENFLEAC